MKTVLTLVAIALFLSTATAWARKPCEELKTEIAAGLDAKGVQHYTLEIIAKDSQDPRRTVGSCNGGSEKIVYERQPAPQPAAVAKR
ncbi:DUF1161 domain-containing protein [Tahibacter harae]|uniref:DUF1161 domain-containing protein n=1 Tax=Tahibacter harae TaxID=2963937 RepID=A0ABT1QRX6_9GAMM|nr:DUF1161 domain-containing protein [Tahibacter harae]